jgi:hypothetical protein
MSLGPLMGEQKKRSREALSGHFVLNACKVKGDFFPAVD